MKHTTAQSGSVFFIIILAIAMFAGLSYAVFRGGSEGTAQLSNDQARLAAQEIIAYGDVLAKTVQTLKLRGCADTQFDFENTAWIRANSTLSIPAGENPIAPASGCDVFGPTDGKISAIVFNQSYFDPNITPSGTQILKGTSDIFISSMPGIGSAEADLVYHLPHLKAEVCMQINKSQNINDGLTIPAHSITDWTQYVGTFTTSNPVNDSTGLLTGKSVYCSNHVSSNRFYRVLIAR